MINSKNISKILGEQIGKGGFGTVYTLKDIPSLCIKKSSKNSTCRIWSDEYKKIKKIIEKTKVFLDKLKIVNIIEPEDFFEDDFGNCYMILKRIYRPEGKNVIKPTLQSLFGEKDYNETYEGRGQFIGIKQIKEYVSEENLEKAAYELGIAMGLLHFVAKNDAYDIEVLLGKEENSKICRFYIIDFDLSENIEKYDKNTLDRMVWSLAAVDYFPNKSNKKLLDLFIKGYMEIAAENKINKEIVMYIIEEYLK